MTTTRRFVCDDLFKFNNVNLDVLTETVRLALRSPFGACVLTLCLVTCVLHSTTWGSTSSIWPSGLIISPPKRLRVDA